MVARLEPPVLIKFPYIFIDSMKYFCVFAVAKDKVIIFKYLLNSDYNKTSLMVMIKMKIFINPKLNDKGQIYYLTEFTGWRFNCDSVESPVNSLEITVVYPSQYEVCDGLYQNFHIQFVMKDVFLKDVMFYNVVIRKRVPYTIEALNECTVEKKVRYYFKSDNTVFGVNYVPILPVNTTSTRCTLFDTPLQLLEVFVNEDVVSMKFFGLLTYGSRNELQMIERINNEFIEACKENSRTNSTD
ncbi:hypothetical protein RF11_11106 [Thelohanellus kitauei]|uniref:Uncharacterized protein n=1 Tax=Thelohanellus kitauei TaxID=669202 RepID=A0A0C2MZ89_THEKT|nr:hypothetical protein RF11_11106 [Thelohanellus kitauei]